MRVTLLVKNGYLAGRRTWRHAGQSVTVGRTSRAEFVIADDNHMSGLHFEIECRIDQCWLRDLGSSNGTFLNDERIQEGKLRNGDKIAAGRTMFTVELTVDSVGQNDAVPSAGSEALPAEPGASATWQFLPPVRQDPPEGSNTDPQRAPRPVSASSGWVESPASQFRLDEPASASIPIPASSPALAPARPSARRLSFSGVPGFVPADPQGTLLAMIDAAADPALLARARIKGHEPRSLLSGTRALALADVGPMLYRIEQGSSHFGDWSSALGRHSGVLIDTAASTEAMELHLKELMYGQGPVGHTTLFRCYDPRVLRAFVFTAAPNEVRRVFGPIRAWICESAAGDEFSAFIFDENGAAQERAMGRMLLVRGAADKGG